MYSGMVTSDERYVIAMTNNIDHQIDIGTSMQVMTAYMMMVLVTKYTICGHCSQTKD